MKTHMTHVVPLPHLHKVGGPWACRKHDFLGSAQWLSFLGGSQIYDQFWSLGTYESDQLVSLLLQANGQFA